MPIIKCKMCGGDLNIVDDSTVCECEYCGTKQTVPKVDDEKKLKLFERANRLRMACEFDKAAGVYESIVADFDEEPEAYWGLVLCKFGIEYVDDPATGNKVPTCHRSSFDSLMDDPNFDMVMECADPVARRVYREEAKQIEELRKRIIEVSAREEPYDVFISYKELDDEGQRTLDSVIAQDIYAELTEKGYRVFFSRISLEDKLGVEYEPYIFAALNSAKVMLVVGTDYDYFNAVWVKNEWSRFLSLIAKGEKKTLIPVFKGIDAYDMPKEFRKLAAQDMGKVGAMQDLVRGVEKLLGKKGAEDAPKEQPVIVQSGGPNVTALLDRGNMALEDHEWTKANEYFDQVLNIDSRNSNAFLGLFMAEMKFEDMESLHVAYTSVNSTIRNNKNIIRARKFARKEVLQLFDTWDLEAAEKKAAKEKADREAAERARIRAEAARIAQERADKEAAAKAEEYNKMREKQRAYFLANFDSIHRKAEIAATMIAAGENHIVGLKADGTVITAGLNDLGQCNTASWENIIAVAAGDNHTLGLKPNGTVVAVGDNQFGQCDVSDWNGIIAVAAGKNHTIGLREDGTVVAVGLNSEGCCDTKEWKDIVAIGAGGAHSLGVKSSGTVVAVGDNRNGQCNVNSWKNIVSVDAGWFHTIGLKKDGTTVAAGSNYSKQCNVDNWSGIVSVSANGNYTMGLDRSGSVVTGGDNYSIQEELEKWDNVIAISAGGSFAVGVKIDGSVICEGDFEDIHFVANKWRLFSDYDSLEEAYQATIARDQAKQQAVKERADAERKAAEERAEAARRTALKKAEAEQKAAAERAEAERRAAIERAESERKARIEKLEKEKNALKVELDGLAILFTGKRRREIEARLAEIETELQKLG